MISTLYVEEAVRDHPRTSEICARLPAARRILCQRYGEVFNRKAQSFRLQKRHPALILAQKFDHHVLDAPSGYGIGCDRNYYFSHTLNCIYDCRYCFLQGMYRSAHYVLFVNYESFQEAIVDRIRQAPGEESYFFSGYDGDSLALDAVTGFVESFLPFFSAHPHAFLELRSKSTQIGALLRREPVVNCIVAWSFTPPAVAAALEHRTPSVERRLEAMVKLQERGWRLGLRFDPLVDTPGFEEHYRQLFHRVLTRLEVESLHSVSLGPFRLPQDFYRRMVQLYPEEGLFAAPLETRQGMVSYSTEREEEMMEFCRQELLQYVPRQIFFPCSV